MMKGVPKDEMVTGRVTSKHKFLMRKHNVTVSDLCSFYFANFGSNKKRLEIELTCVNNRLSDLEEEKLRLLREKEALENSLGVATVEHLTKSNKVSDGVRSTRSRKFRKEELDKIKKNL